MLPKSSRAETTYPILALVPGSVEEFVAHWSPRYFYPAEELYATNIGRTITPERLEALFLWKNGGKLSNAKLRSIRQHYVSRCGDLRKLPPLTTAEDFLRQFGGGGPIWRIFLLHCWNPDRFPIYDQHVHRAMEYMQTGEVHEISSSANVVIRSYIDKYLPFWQQFGEAPDRNADKALWVFGKFLKEFRGGL